MKKRKGDKMQKGKLQALGFITVLLLLSSACSTKKHLPEGESLYDNGEVVINSDTIPADKKKLLSEHLEGLLMPKPNKKLLGLRIKSGLYYMGGGDSVTNNIVRKWIKGLGAKPVFLSDVNREYNENLVRNKLENIGFFNAEVTSDTTINNKEATVTYTATPNLIYRIKSVKFDIDSTSQIGKDILESKDRSLLIVGQNYSLDVILNERDRIDNELKNKGYYYFNPENLLVQVDSSIGNHKVDMYVVLKKETPEQAKHPQKIGNIYIYPNYQLSNSGYQLSNPRNAELFRDNYYIIDRKNTFRKPVIANHIFFKRGDTYNRHNHNLTINHLVNLNSFKFVKNNFVDSKDSTNTLDVYYYLTPLPKKSLRLELLGKMASVYNGSELNVTWSMRNAFRGAEQLSLNVFGGYETQTGGSVNLNSSYYRYGAELTYSLPRLLTPFKWSGTRKYIPKTYFKTGFEFLNRKAAYQLNSIKFDYGYAWKETDEKQHDLSVLEVIYVQPRNVSDDYRAQMDTVPSLRHIIDPQFSFGPNYNYTYTNTMNTALQNTFYFKGGVDLSGNILGLIQGANYAEGKRHKIFNAYYAQYIKLQADARHYFKLSETSQIASRVAIGYSYSYGNSNSLPYLKQYFVGGPNSLRAFRARAIGPGSSAPQNVGQNNFFADQTGDLKLELNTEYRAKLASIVHWAAFIDAGNVWLQNEDPDKPGGKFSKDFISELAVGAGAGLRFDFTFLILRTDFAIPLRVPYLPKGDRWVFKDIDFGSKTWRSNNLVFNLAIGYPF
ncbi:BamA/TamA family outer membrane protein [Sphingobacterium spiritivorum]|uniref:translocation and assembly module lipoprotein TamL n=1 Tax=Sphingobacterium spiritivorum TaxID=258 RepID=UPI003DA2A77D